MNPNDPNTPYALMAEMGHVLANQQRLRLIHLLCQCDRTVEELAEAMKEPMANVSHHLQLLKKVRVVSTRRLGRHIAYGLADETVRNFWPLYRDFSIDRLVELQLLKGTLAVQRGKRGGLIERKSLVSLLKKNAVVLLDVRPQEEYDAGHLAGAISFPLGELVHRIKELPADKMVVLYCRGPYCLLGDMAQEQLAARAINALRLEDSIIDWINAGLPVKRSRGYKSLVNEN
ncbi:MAG: metalloregulator ArsR/SmtB family transcription factor [Candidatus Didemnitutus sp.]|nr:metalloregulator ArsR/SmtB family transcription factor [Candidatus Didemnitutus sp.]